MLATLIGLVAGFFRGPVDGVLSRFLDVVWAFPVYLLAISLSIVLLTSELELGPITLKAGSLWLPIFILGIVYLPYVARPIRGEVLALREREFVEASIGLGASNWRILAGEILPNVVTTVIVFFPLMVALNMLTEAALSFLSIGVQPPDASWGTIILDGQELLYTRPAVAIAPGIAIAVTVLALNVFGDGVREALDPRAKLRGTAPDAALRPAPAALDGVRAVRDQRARVRDLLCDPGRRSGGAHRGPQRGSGDPRSGAQGLRLRQAAARAVRDDDAQAVRDAGPRIVRQPRRRR